MENLPIQGDTSSKVVAALKRSTLFSGMEDGVLGQMVERCSLRRYAPAEAIVTAGEPSEAFYLILSGQAKVLVPHKTTGELIEVSRMGPGDGIGEIGLLLGGPRSASVEVTASLLALVVEKRLFDMLFEKTPGFSRSVCRSLADRLVKVGAGTGPRWDLDKERPDAETVAMLPVEFVQRHRVLPVKREGSVLTVGFVDPPEASTVNLIRQNVPGMEIITVQIDARGFNDVLRSQAGWGAAPAATAAHAAPSAAADKPVADTGKPTADKGKPAKGSGGAADAVVGGKIDLDLLLRRMVAEGASDLHLSGGQIPRWRIDGEMLEIAGTPRLEATTVYEMLAPVMREAAREEFDATNDCDFAHAIEGCARFRVNLFRDKGGVGTVMRVIPAKILTMEQLALPPAAAAFCKHRKGMVLVTGPTGSGKSTTLAAMIDHINRSHAGHVLTMEDPIEFVHESRKCLVNQRELGSHTQSFTRSLRAALREDPDIVLVGEMRDLETVALALEISNTGHLVFGTLHTTTAINTVDRIIDMFPPEQQNQVRASLAESLKGVVAQNLCKRIGGGRVGAYEVLVCNSAVANLIREGKTHQIASIMQTGKALGNTLINEELARLVNEGKVDFTEAMSRTPDKRDLARRLGREYKED